MGELSDSFVAGLAGQAQVSGRPSPLQLYQYFTQVKHADPKVALMLTGAAGAESGFSPTAEHDPDKDTGIPVGYGMWGHGRDRRDAMFADAGTTTPNWQQQASFAYDESVQRGDAQRAIEAQTPHDLAVAQMHYEQPQGYTPDNPEGGKNFSGRLSLINQFAPLAQGQDVKYSGPTFGSVGAVGAGQGGDASNPAAPLPQASGGGLADSFIQNLVAPQAQAQAPAPHPAPQIMNPTVGGQQQDQALRNYVSQVQPVPNNNSSWGPGQQFMSSLVPGGLGVRAAALGAAGNNALSGNGFNYGDELSSLQGQQALWQHENPSANALASTAGNVVGTTAALGAGGTAMRLGGNALAQAVPALADPLASAASFAGGIYGATPATKLANPFANMLARGSSLATSGALQGEASSAYGEGGLPSAPGRDAIIGAAANTLLGPLGSYVHAPERATVNPLIQQGAKDLSALGVPVAPANVLQDSGMAKTAASAVSSSFKQQQLQALTDKAAEAIGVAPGVGLTPETISVAKRAIGAKLDAVAASTPVVPLDTNALTALSGMRQQALANLPDDTAKTVMKAISNIEDASLTGVGNNGVPSISGAIYQDLTKSGNLISSLCDNASTYQYGKQLRWVLDQALEGAAPQEMKGVTAQARQQWGDAVTLGHAQAKSDSGVVDPVGLLNWTSKGGVSDTLKTLGAAGNMNFPRPTGAGGVKGASGDRGFISNMLSHGGPTQGLIGAAAVLGGNQLVDHLGDIAHYMPGEAVPAAVAAAAAGVGGLALRSARKSALTSPSTTNMLLQGGLPQVRPNATIPLAVQMYQNGRLPWEQQ